MQLSRRLLVITPSGIHYHCAKEDNSYPSFRIWSLPSIHHVTCWSAYSTIVTEYTSRHLSHKSDTLNAIAEMTKSLSRFADDSFVAGMPSRLITWSLLWQPTAPSVRRTPWPSWSWAGWTGYGQSMCPVIYLSDGHLESYDADPNKWPVHYGGSRFRGSLRQVELHIPDSGMKLELNEKKVGYGARSRYRQYCTHACTFPCSKLANLAADQPFHESGILTFKAKILEIRIEPTGQKSPNFPQLHRCHLFIGVTWVGCMFLPENDLPAQPIVDAEFVVLTDLESYTDKYKTEVFGGMLGASPDAAAFEQSFVEAAERHTQQQYQGWTQGMFHSKRGWTGRRMGRDTFHDVMEDAHFGMPYPPTVALSHVLWITRDEEQDLAFRRGLGIVTQSYGGHEETVRLA